MHKKYLRKLGHRLDRLKHGSPSEKRKYKSIEVKLRKLTIGR